jgi:quercetin dioxygenase-like cupin family protein
MAARRLEEKQEETPMTTIRALGLALLATTVAAAPPAAVPPDPAVTDGDKYHVVLENEHVRVLRYHDEPGQKTHLHHHPNFVMVALAFFRRRLTLPDGSRRVREFRAGEAAWMPAQSHIGENIGDGPTEGLLIELK